MNWIASFTRHGYAWCKRSRKPIRAGGPASNVQDFGTYAAETEGWFADVGDRGDALDIDFRFLERIAGGDLASERGVYQITATKASGEQRVFYGKFHTFSRRTGGRWHIAVDYDSNESGTITADTFAAGTPIDDVDPYANP